ncbi:MAG: hypothetical protein WBC74_05975 [Candidatus Omnitrophota bacterium]
MFEQFSSYPEMKWHAAARAKFIGLGGKIPINPDLDNFRLESFIDLRKKRMPGKRLMLIDNVHTTNIFIEGPDPLLDKVTKRLPKYIGKPWVGINKMSLEKDFRDCGNLSSSLCDPWVRDNFRWKSNEDREAHDTSDFEKIKEICAKCENFEFEIDK